MDAPPGVHTPGGTVRRTAAAAAIGGLAGLAWAAALRAYMAQLVPIPQVTWFGTFVAVLLPGLVPGVLLGIAWARGTTGRRGRLGWFALARTRRDVTTAASRPAGDPCPGGRGE